MFLEQRTFPQPLDMLEDMQSPLGLHKQKNNQAGFDSNSIRLKSMASQFFEFDILESQLVYLLTLHNNS